MLKRLRTVGGFDAITQSPTTRAHPDLLLDIMEASESDSEQQQSSSSSLSYAEERDRTISAITGGARDNVARDLAHGLDLIKHIEQLLRVLQSQLCRATPTTSACARLRFVRAFTIPVTRNDFDECARQVIASANAIILEVPNAQSLLQTSQTSDTSRDIPGLDIGVPLSDDDDNSSFSDRSSLPGDGNMSSSTSSLIARKIAIARETVAAEAELAAQQSRVQKINDALDNTIAQLNALVEINSRASIAQ